MAFAGTVSGNVTYVIKRPETPLANCYLEELLACYNVSSHFVCFFYTYSFSAVYAHKNCTRGRQGKGKAKEAEKKETMEREGNRTGKGGREIGIMPLVDIPVSTHRTSSPETLKLVLFACLHVGNVFVYTMVILSE